MCCMQLGCGVDSGYKPSVTAELQRASFLLVHAVDPSTEHQIYVKCVICVPLSTVENN
jgi:hypothetical protein